MASFELDRIGKSSSTMSFQLPRLLVIIVATLRLDCSSRRVGRCLLRIGSHLRGSLGLSALADFALNLNAKPETPPVAKRPSA